MEGIKANDKVKGTVSITPSGSAHGGRPIAAFEIFVDGRLVARNMPGNTLEIDTTKLADGYHELRIVGAAADPIETQGRLILPFYAQNHGAELEIKVSPLRAKRPASSASTSGSRATAITIRQNSRDLGRVQGEAGEVEISAATLGRGAIALQAFSEGKVQAVSAPVRVQVE